MIKLHATTKNLEGALSFLLFGVLVFVSVHFLMSGGEKENSGGISSGVEMTKGNQQKHIEETLKNRELEQRVFAGSIASKPVSHDALIIRRNIFAPVLPLKGLPQPQDLALVGRPSQTPDGKWTAVIQNTKTGKVYRVKVNDVVAELFTVVKIEEERVILSFVGKEIVLLAPKREPELEELELVSIPSKSEDGQWVAEIRNRRTGQAYTVRELQLIEGTFLVKKIGEDGVVLGREGKGDTVLSPPAGPVGKPRPYLCCTGIIQLTEGAIVQIENTRTGEIYFKREGEKIDETTTVKKIEKNKVILQREGEEDIILILGE